MLVNAFRKRREIGGSLEREKAAPLRIDPGRDRSQRAEGEGEGVGRRQAAHSEQKGWENLSCS